MRVECWGGFVCESSARVGGGAGRGGWEQHRATGPTGLGLRRRQREEGQEDQERKEENEKRLVAIDSEKTQMKEGFVKNQMERDASCQDEKREIVRY
mgnify:CR=1 FL=1